MTMRQFEVIKPSNEAELFEQLRDRALASGVLRLIALEELDELSRARGDTATEEQVDLQFDLLHRGDLGDALPFLIGLTLRHATDTTGQGRLEVTVGDNDESRKLKLYILED